MSFSSFRILPRQDVFLSLSGAVRQYRLVVLTAPMGYGKTTVAQNILKELDGYKIFYFSVGQGICNEMYLWDSLWESFGLQGSTIAETMRNMGFPLDNIQLQRTLEICKKHNAGAPTVLVLDDYHFAQLPIFDTFLERMVREDFPNLCIFILSRTRPNLPLEELSIKRLAVVFDKSILAFSESEAEEYFSINGVTESNVAKQAWRFTEGWPAALWLSLNSYIASKVLFSINDLDNLLGYTIFSSYSNDEKKLLLELSILESFTLKQASFVSSLKNVRGILRSLHDKNALLNYDDNTDVYRLHSIFRNFLLKRLSDYQVLQENLIDIEALYGRAAEWFAEQGDFIKSIRFFAKAGGNNDLKRILELFAKPHASNFILFDPEGLQKIVDGIPWNIRCACPIGYLGFVYQIMSRVNLQKGTELLARAEEFFSSSSDITPDICNQIAGEIELIRGLEAFNDLWAMRECHLKAHDLLKGKSTISHPELVWTFGSPHVSFLYLRKSGDYVNLIDLVEKNLFYYQDLTGGCSAGAQDLFHAEYLLETAKYKDVQYFLDRARYRANARKQLASELAIAFTKARLALLGGDASKVMEAIDQVLPQMAMSGNPLLANSLDLCRGYLWAVQDCLEKIPAWILSGEIASTPNFYQGLSFAHIVHGKALLVAKDWVRLEALTEDLPSKLGKYDNLFARIHIFVLRAVAVAKLGDEQRAIAYMRKAIRFAEKDHIVFSIAEYGRVIVGMLKELLQESNSVFLKCLYHQTRKFCHDTEQTHSIITKREKEVLSLAAKGNSNVDIGRSLFITPATVGNILSRIYAKLEVRNRAEAVKKLDEI